MYEALENKPSNKNKNKKMVKKNQFPNKKRKMKSYTQVLVGLQNPFIQVWEWDQSIYLYHLQNKKS